MNLLIVDADGVGLDLALRAMSHGHSVKLFIKKEKDGTRDRSGDGLVEKVSDWEKWMQWADLIVPTTNTTYLDRLEYFRKLRYPIFGPSLQSAQLEINRQYGMEVMKKHGIDLVPFKMFKSFDEVEAYLWKHDERCVFKCLGTEEDKSLTYVAKDSSDMINQITRWKKSGKKLKGPCMLQDFIDGIEIGVSAWVGKEGFLKPRGENFEYKKLMSGNYGPNTGEMGTVMQYTDKSKLAKLVLEPLEDFLVSVGHRGDVDINCIVDKQGKPWPMEFTCRLGWPAFFIMCSQHEEPVEWMLDALNGKDSLKVSNEVFIGLVLAQPPFPNKNGKREDVTGIPIQGVTEDIYDDLHLCEVMMGKGVDNVDGKPVKKDMLVTTGEYVMTVTGSGNNVRKAKKRVMENIGQIHLPNPIIRDDVGENLEHHLPELQKHGFAMEMEY